MVLRTWGRVLLIALGAGALAGTSQLGLAYGLGLVRLGRAFDGPAQDQWPAQLAWISWIAMMSAVIGALAADRSARREPGYGPGAVTAIAVVAGIGAGIVLPLAMQPARTAQVTGVDPVVVIGICAGLGVVAGIPAGWAAAVFQAARRSVLTVGVVIWLIAFASVAPSLGARGRLPAIRLGVFDAGVLAPVIAQRFALFTMPAVALITGAALGWLARRRKLPPMAVGLAGLAGPALLTVAYLVAGPGVGAERYQAVPYWAAVVATGAGVLGSVLAALVRRADDEPVDDPADSTMDNGTSAPAAGAGSGADTGTGPGAGRPAGGLGAFGAPAGPPAFGPPAAGPPAAGPPPFGPPAAGPPAGGPAGGTKPPLPRRPAGSPAGGTGPGQASGSPSPGADPELSNLFARRGITHPPGPPARPDRRPVPPAPERHPAQSPPAAPPQAAMTPPPRPAAQPPARPAGSPPAAAAPRPRPPANDDYVDWVSRLGDG